MWGYYPGYPKTPRTSPPPDALISTSNQDIEISRKLYKLADSDGMFLHIIIAGNKSCRLKCRFEEKEKLMTFGIFPTITLGEAR